jgi:hypothetical protein
VATTFLEMGFPNLFETMVFWLGHRLDNWSAPATTRDEALAEHEAAVAMVVAARGEGIGHDAP